MRISTEIGSAAKRIGEEKTVELVAKAGFDCWDLSMMAMCRYDKATDVLLENPHPFAGAEYLQFVRRLRRIGLDNGITCNQAHAPFPVAVPGIRDHLKRAIECAAEAGAKICVIHPGNLYTPRQNGDMFRELLPFAKSHGVKIATENMWCWDKEKDQSCFASCATPESFLENLREVSDPDFVACLDIGHAEMRGSGVGAAKTILALGDHLQALHLHDNDGWKDRHQIPFSGSIDFDGVLRALKQIGYQGDFTLEADRYLQDFPDEEIFTGLCNMANDTRRLAQMYEKTD